MAGVLFGAPPRVFRRRSGRLALASNMDRLVGHKWSIESSRHQLKRCVRRAGLGENRGLAHKVNRGSVNEALRYSGRGGRQ